MKKNSKRLAINKDTIRTLNDLQRVRGGAPRETDSCDCPSRAAPATCGPECWPDPP